MHNLLRPTFERLFTMKDDSSTNGATGAEANAMDARMIVEAEQELQNLGLSQSQVEVDFKLIAKKWKQVALAWSQRSDLSLEMVCVRLGLVIQMGMMTKQLNLSSCAWDTKQKKIDLGLDHSQPSSGRKYRLVEAFENNIAESALGDVSRLLLSDLTDKVPLHMAEVRSVCLAFRTWARSGAAIHRFLSCRHKLYPYKLFGVLSNPGLAESILEDFKLRPCILHQKFSAP